MSKHQTDIYSNSNIMFKCTLGYHRPCLLSFWFCLHNVKSRYILEFRYISTVDIVHNFTSTLHIACRYYNSKSIQPSNQSDPFIFLIYYRLFFYGNIRGTLFLISFICVIGYRPQKAPRQELQPYCSQV